MYQLNKQNQLEPLFKYPKLIIGGGMACAYDNDPPNHPTHAEGYLTMDEDEEQLPHFLWDITTIISWDKLPGLIPNSFEYIYFERMPYILIQTRMSPIASNISYLIRPGGRVRIVTAYPLTAQDPDIVQVIREEMVTKRDYAMGYKEIPRGVDINLRAP